MRLKDVEPIIRELQDEEQYGADYFLPIELLKAAPTIEAKTVVHAHWREWWPPQEFILTGEEKLYICSNCDAKYSDVENQRFCPWCGAQMDESISCSHENDKKGE